MTTHELKCWPQYFDAIKRGEKNFEVRKDDRGFQAGDEVVLQRTREDRHYEVEWDWTADNKRPKHELRFRIGWVLTGGQFGLEPGYVAFSLQPMNKRAGRENRGQEK